MISQSEATKDLTAALKGFKLEVGEAMKVVDELTKLDMNYAASAGEIAEALSRTAAVAQLAGMSMEETAAAVTVIMDVTQQGAQMTGVAMRSMLSRFGQVKAGSFASMIADEDDAENINDIEKVLNAIGIQIRSNTLDMRTWTDVLADLNEKWITLSDVEKNAIATAMAGTRQRNSFLTLMSNYDKYREAVVIAEEAEGTATEKYQAYVDSITFSVQRLTAAWEEFTQRLQANGAIKGFANFVAFIVDHMDQIIRVLSTYLIAANAWRFNLSNLKQTFGLQGMAGKFRTITPAGAMSAASGERQTSSAVAKLNNDVNSNLGTIIGLMGGKAPTGSGRGTAPKKPTVGGMRAKIAVGAGLTAGLTSALAGRGTFDTLFGVGGVQDTVTDKLIRGGANALFTGAVTAFLPVLGPILGPLMGDAVSGALKKVLHQQELTRKAIIEQAEKELQAINNVSQAADEMVALSKEDSKFWSADQWKTWRTGIEKLLELAADEVGGKGFNAFFTKLTGKDATTALSNLIDNADLAAQSLVDAAKAAAILAEGEAKYDQGIEDRYQAQAARDKAEKELTYLTSSWAEYVEIYREDEVRRYKTEEEWLQAQKQAQDSLTSAQKKYAKVLLDTQKELDSSRMEAALYSSGVASMTAAEIGNATLEGVAYRILQKWAENGYEGAFVGGQASSSAIKSVEQMLRARGGYESLFSNTTRSYGQIARRAGMLGGNYESYYKAATAQGESELMRLMAGSAYTDLNAFRDFIFGSDPSKLQKIAHGFGMTKDAFEDLGDVLDIITESDAMEGLDKFVEKLKGLVDVFAAFATGAVSQTNINYLLQNAPSLLLNEAGQVDVAGAASRMVGVLTSGGLIDALGGKAWKEAQTSTELWSLYTESRRRQGLSEIDAAYKNFDQYYNSLTDDAAKQALIDEFSAVVSTTTTAYEIYNTLQEQATKLGKHYIQQEIDGLESIKESLGDINRQREKEIALLKARDALENAKNEKKRVYREGMGFVYTADTEAIKEAEQNLSKLETERQQDDIQYQIDTLKNQQEILDNIQNNKQLAALEESFEGWISKQGTFGQLYGIISNRFGPDAVKDTEKDRIKQEAQDTQKQRDEADEEAWRLLFAQREEYATARQAYLDSLNNPNVSAEQRKQLYNSASDLWTKYQSNLAGHVTGSGVYSRMTAEQQDYYNPAASGLGELDTSKQYVSIWKVGGGTKGTGFANIDLNDLSPFTAQDTEWWKTGKLSLYNGNGWNDIQSLEGIGAGNIVRLSRAEGTWLAYVGQNGQMYYPGIEGNMDRNNRGLFTGYGFVSSGHKRSGYVVPSNAGGTYSFGGGRTFINEFGTEGIVTPYGTLTALPAKSGVVPADLTKNLFDLGEVAPTLVRRMEHKDLIERTGGSSEDNSMNIQNFYARFETGEGFDFEQLLVQARQYVALSKQNRNR